MALLEITNLVAGFDTPQGFMRAVDGVDISVGKGEVVGLVGESGCGKSTVAFSILSLLPHPTGQIIGGGIFFEGQNLLDLDEKALCDIRGKEISMIFQEPMSALNPVMRIGAQVAESLILHDKVSKKEATEAVRKILLRVGLSEEKAKGRSYPHELSGGERQRVMIAMALICKPKLIIADEPTTALDASLQTQIIELLASLQKETGASILFITHDLGLVKRFCDKVYVMYAGVVAEEGRSRDIFEFPRHPYTRALLDSRPADNIPPKTLLRSIEGRLPTFWEWESGCRFAPRCPYAKEICKKPQELLPTHTTRARCCRWSEIGREPVV